MKLKKTKKSVGQRGETTHGHGARKKWKKSGHRGGCGMAGTGKRGDQKKTMITAKYGNTYFGKQGVTSRGTAKKRVKVINVGDIINKFPGQKEIDLSGYKVLGRGEVSVGLNVKALDISDGAREKIEKAGGSVEVLREKDSTTPESNANINNLKQDEGSENVKRDDELDEKIKVIKEKESE